MSFPTEFQFPDRPGGLVAVGLQAGLHALNRGELSPELASMLGEAANALTGALSSLGGRDIRNLAVEEDCEKVKKPLIATAVLTAVFALGMILAGILMAVTPFTLVAGIVLGIAGAGMLATAIPMIMNAVRMAKLKQIQNLLKNDSDLPLPDAYKQKGISMGKNAQLASLLF